MWRVLLIDHYLLGISAISRHCGNEQKPSVPSEIKSTHCCLYLSLSFIPPHTYSVLPPLLLFLSLFVCDSSSQSDPAKSLCNTQQCSETGRSFRLLFASILSTLFEYLLPARSALCQLHRPDDVPTRVYSFLRFCMLFDGLTCLFC